MALHGNFGSPPLLIETEQQQLLVILQELRTVIPEIEAIQPVLAKLINFISLLKSRLNPSETKAKTDDVRLLLLKYLLISGDHFHRLDVSLARVSYKQEPDAQKSLIEKAIDIYEELNNAELHPRLLRDTTQLMEVLNIIDELGDKSFTAFTEQMEQLQLVDIIQQLRARKSLTIIQEFLENLNTIICRVESRHSARKIDSHSDDPRLLLVRYLMLKEEERERLLMTLEKPNNHKTPCISDKQVIEFNKFVTNDLLLNNIQFLSEKKQIDLLDILNKTRITDARLIKIRDQLERLQLCAVVNKLSTAPRSLLRLKDQLIKCSWLLAAIESRFPGDSTPPVAEGDHALLLKYLLLSKDEHGEFIEVPLNTLRVVEPKSEDGPAIIRKQLAAFNRFKQKELSIKNLHSLISSHVSLSEAQRQQLLTIIKQHCIKNCDLIISQVDICIKMLDFAKKENLKSIKEHMDLLTTTVGLINSLIAYATNQDMFFDPAMKKQIDKLNVKIEEMITKKEDVKKNSSSFSQSSGEKKRLEKNLKRLGDNKETIAKINMCIILDLLSQDLFLPIFESQITVLNENEIQAHLATLSDLQLDKIQDEAELIRLTTLFYVSWRIPNQFILQGFAASLPLFKIMDNLIYTELKNKKDEHDDAADYPKKTGISVDVLEKIADSPLLIKGTSKRKLFVTNVDQHIKTIVSALELIDAIQKRLKSLKKPAETPKLHQRARSKSTLAKQQDKHAIETPAVFIPPLALLAPDVSKEDTNTEPLKQRNTEEQSDSPKKQSHPKRAQYKDLRGISAMLPRFSVLSPRISDDSALTDRTEKKDKRDSIDDTEKKSTSTPTLKQ